MRRDPPGARALERGYDVHVIDLIVMGVVAATGVVFAAKTRGEAPVPVRIRRRDR